jgi:hypothetical protein
LLDNKGKEQREITFVIVVVVVVAAAAVVAARVNFIGIIRSKK